MCYFKATSIFFKLEHYMFIAFADDLKHKQTNMLDKSDNKCFYFCRELTKHLS